MKVVVNTTWNTFKVSAEAAEKLNLARTDSELIEFVEHYPEKCPNLEIINIPEEVTDWEISEYNGKEHIICVIDGKIKHLFNI